jgi:hypothetical protein
LVFLVKITDIKKVKEAEGVPTTSLLFVGAPPTESFGPVNLFFHEPISSRETATKA